MQAPESDPANAVHGAKVMVIGLDSVDPQLLERGCAAGFLPNLAALRSEGVSGRIDTPAGMADDAVWASFSTGRTPAQHGRYHFRTVITGSYELLRFKTRNFDCPPFWEALSQAGKRVAVIDVPKSPSARQFDGIQIHDWRVHGRDGETATTPPELAKELAKNKKAKENFDKLAPSYRRQYIGWIAVAKRAETKKRRIEESIALLEKGKRLGMK